MKIKKILFEGERGNVLLERIDNTIYIEETDGPYIAVELSPDPDVDIIKDQYSLFQLSLQVARGCVTEWPDDKMAQLKLGFHYNTVVSQMR